MGSELKHGIDAVAYANVVATIVGWLPPIAAALTVVWLTIQITEKIVGKPFVEVVRCFLDRFKKG